MTWACIWTLYSADLCFCFVSDLFYFLTQPVQFDIEPRIIHLAQDCFGYTYMVFMVFTMVYMVFIVGILCVCFHMNFKHFFSFVKNSIGIIWGLHFVCRLP